MIELLFFIEKPSRNKGQRGDSKDIHLELRGRFISIKYLPPISSGNTGIHF
jgi:hypothetical protein